MAFQNRSSAPIGRDENFVYFEFLEGQFYKGKPSLQLAENLAFLLKLPFPSVCFSGVFFFNLEMRNTGLVYHRH